MADTYKYQSGHSNHFASEALPDTLPPGQNAPQVVAHGLVAEQLSGTSFTTPRVKNQRTWLYRIRPSVAHEPYTPLPPSFCPLLFSDFEKSGVVTPQQLRWKSLKVSSSAATTFVQGLATFCGYGSPEAKSGLAIHMYGCNTSMSNQAMMNSDGDLLIVPQENPLHIRTEMGLLRVEPLEIVVIPRGIKFSVQLENEGRAARGYICETYTGHFTIPDLGPVGANGCANPRDFLAPVAAYESGSSQKFSIVNKFCGRLFESLQSHSCFDVVGWHGNYVPYKYDLRKFNAMGTVTFDHPDPSIFTVLTCQVPGDPGVAVADFVIFPPRWAVGEHTFRPPYYHRNCMSEYMGLIEGAYEAKDGQGFVPGGGSLHSCMSAHGPEAAVFQKASSCELKPQRVADGSMAFMFESTFMFRVAPWCLDTTDAAQSLLDVDYWKCWEGCGVSHFTAPQP